MGQQVEYGPYLFFSTQKTDCALFARKFRQLLAIKNERVGSSLDYRRHFVGETSDIVSFTTVACLANGATSFSNSHLIVCLSISSSITHFEALLSVEIAPLAIREMLKMVLMNRVFPEPVAPTSKLMDLN